MENKPFIWDNKLVSLALGVGITFNFESQRITTDSRKIQPGDIFVALKGENFDGNKFAANAIEQGAVAAIIDDSNLSGEKFIKVENALDALQDIGHFRRINSTAKFIAITGSVGKTGTKEMIYAVLSSKYKTYKTTGNLNNHIGLPLTLANMPDEIDYAVIEMGMNHAGEISDLVEICEPNIAAITWVSEAHIENLGSEENIALAKAEIFESMGDSPAAVIPADNKLNEILFEAANENGINDIYEFGQKVNSVKTGDSSAVAYINGDKVLIDNVILENQVLNNVLLALTIAAICEVDLEQAVKAIAGMEIIKGRGGKIELKNGGVIIDDSYNASPASMKNALKKFSTYKADRKIAALGDMRELGSFSQKYHEELERDINNIDLLVTCGTDMKFLFEKMKDKIPAKHFDDISGANEFLSHEIKKGDAVLIKGSHGSNMWKLVDMISGK